MDWGGLGLALGLWCLGCSRGSLGSGVGFGIAAVSFGLELGGLGPTGWGPLVSLAGRSGRSGSAGHGGLLVLLLVLLVLLACRRYAVVAAVDVFGVDPRQLSRSIRKSIRNGRVRRYSPGFDPLLRSF